MVDLPSAEHSRPPLSPRKHDLVPSPSRLIHTSTFSPLKFQPDTSFSSSSSGEDVFLSTDDVFFSPPPALTSPRRPTSTAAITSPTKVPLPPSPLKSQPRPLPRLKAGTHHPAVERKDAPISPSKIALPPSPVKPVSSTPVSHALKPRTSSPTSLLGLPGDEMSMIADCTLGESFDSTSFEMDMSRTLPPKSTLAHAHPKSRGEDLSHKKMPEANPAKILTSDSITGRTKSPLTFRSTSKSLRTFPASSSGQSLASVGEEDGSQPLPLILPPQTPSSLLASTRLPLTAAKHPHLLRDDVQLLSQDPIDEAPSFRLSPPPTTMVTLATTPGKSRRRASPEKRERDEASLDVEQLLAKMGKPKRPSGTEESFVDLLRANAEDMDFSLMAGDDSFLPPEFRSPRARSTAPLSANLARLASPQKLPPRTPRSNLSPYKAQEQPLQVLASVLASGRATLERLRTPAAGSTAARSPIRGDLFQPPSPTKVLSTARVFSTKQVGGAATPGEAATRHARARSVDTRGHSEVGAHEERHRPFGDRTDTARPQNLHMRSRSTASAVLATTKPTTLPGLTRASSVRSSPTRPSTLTTTIPSPRAPVSRSSPAKSSLPPSVSAPSRSTTTTTAKIRAGSTPAPATKSSSSLPALSHRTPVSNRVERASNVAVPSQRTAPAASTVSTGTSTARPRSGLPAPPSRGFGTDARGLTNRAAPATTAPIPAKTSATPSSTVLISKREVVKARALSTPARVVAASNEGSKVGLSSGIAAPRAPIQLVKRASTQVGDKAATTGSALPVPVSRIPARHGSTQSVSAGGTGASLSGLRARVDQLSAKHAQGKR